MKSFNVGESLRPFIEKILSRRNIAYTFHDGADVIAPERSFIKLLFVPVAKSVVKRNDFLLIPHITYRRKKTRKC